MMTLVFIGLALMLETALDIYKAWKDKEVERWLA